MIETIIHANKILIDQGLITGIVIALWACFIGACWGAFVRKYLFNRPLDQYSTFDVGRIGLGALGTLMLFEWLIRVPIAVLAYPESLYHLTTGAWIQVWIATFAAGSMAGYTFGRKYFHTRLIPLRAGLEVKDDGIILVQPVEHKSDTVTQ